MTPPPDPAAHAEDAALAAGLLANACEEAPRRRGHNDAARLRLVRDLALDLRHRLTACAGGDVFSVAEAARAAADLAGLAACNADLLTPGTAEETVRRCAAAVRGLCDLVEDDAPGYAATDARSALWRAELAVRQVEETPAEG